MSASHQKQKQEIRSMEVEIPISQSAMPSHIFVVNALCKKTNEMHKFAIEIKVKFGWKYTFKWVILKTKTTNQKSSSRIPYYTYMN